jgi:hypothetical protein
MAVLTVMTISLPSEPQRPATLDQHERQHKPLASRIVSRIPQPPTTPQTPSILPRSQ